MTASPPRLLHPSTAPRRSSSCVLKQPLLAARGDRLLDAQYDRRCHGRSAGGSPAGPPPARWRVIFKLDRAAARRRSSRRAGGATLLLLRVRRVEFREHVFGVALRVDLLPDLLDPAVRSDPERRPRHAPVALPVIVLLFPHAVHLGDVGGWIGEQREIQLVLAAELVMAFQ